MPRCSQCQVYEAREYASLCAACDYYNMERRALKAEGERDALRAVGRALLAYLTGDGMPTLHVCNACESRLATRTVAIGFRRQPASHRHVICDTCEVERACSSEGAEVCGVTDLPIAAPLRRLRALVEVRT